MKEKRLHNFIKKYNSLEVIIGIIVVVFIISQILMAFDWFSLRRVALPYSVDELLLQPWRIITYGFFHQDFLSLFFNMLLLFYFGSIMLDFARPALLKYVFIAGVIAGGLFFMGGYALFPSIYIEKVPLLGSSAGVMAVMTYISMLMPHYQIKIRFLGFFKLIHILIFFIAFNLLQIPLGNPGGYFAHIGGLTAGFLFFLIIHLLPEKQNKKVVYTQSDETENHKIDRILEKISRSGYDSLTQKEKEELFKQSKK